MTPFKLRFLSAIILIGVMYLLFLGGPDFLKVFVLITMVLIQWEGCQLIFKDSPALILKINFSLGVLATFLGAMTHFFASLSFIFIIGACLHAFILPKVYFHNKITVLTLQNQIFKFSHFLLYIVGIPSFVYAILNLEKGTTWFLFLISTTLASDTFAYLTGRFLGKRPLIPLLSPNKTLEGSIGGAIGSALVGTLFYSSLPETSFLSLTLIALLSGLFGQMGDLLESLLKRNADKKDSGFLIPGHGGVLDRVDGIILSAPWIYWVAHFNLKFF